MAFEKGISSVTLALVVIVAVVVVAAIVSTYLPQLPQTSTNVVGQGNDKQVACGTGAVSLSDVRFCNNAISGFVANTGSVPLGNITLILSYTNATHETIYLTLANGSLSASPTCCSDVAMAPNENFAFTFPVGGSKGNYEAVRVTTNCTNPEVSGQAVPSAC